MDKLEIIGGKKLQGSILISGSKNATLPILAASILSKKIILKNVPFVKDIYTMMSLLTSLGSSIKCNKNKKIIEINNPNKLKTFASYNLVKTMRAGVLVLGSLLAKFGKAKVGATSGDSTSTGTTVIDSLARKIINAARVSSVTPYGGHSYDNVAELYGYTIMINQNFAGTESGVADATNDFRQIALVQNPLEQNVSGSEEVAVDAIYNHYVRVEFAGDVTSTVQVDDEISDKSAATADKTVFGRVVSATHISGTDGSSSNVTRVLLTGTSGFYNKSYADIYYLNDNNRLYLSDDVSANTNPYTALTLSTAFGTNLADANSKKIYYRGLNSSADTTSQGLKPLSGDIMYMENRAPISRATDQTENVKLIIEY